ncbi:MAG: NBR1-Ig-like domain-containing protein [Anaerolineales bacterium]
MKKYAYGLTLIIVCVLVILVSCNLPGGQMTPASPDEAFTEEAETVSAKLTQVALQASPTSNIPTNTLTPISTSTSTPTNTPAYTPTNTPIPCNLASFISDVTYPDNTQVAQNQAFIKTWRVKNVGSCSWNSNYLLIFDHGDGMGVTAGYTQQLTTSVVNPGQMVDLTVNLTAPAANGTYTGYWRMRDPGGVVFGITPAGGTFLVKIKVVTATSVTLAPIVAESGAVRSDGGVFPGDIVVGDASNNDAIQAFISYNISSIPADATITEVQDEFNTNTIGGNPFGNLGILNCYKMNFAVPLVASNFVTGFPSGNIADWGSTNILNQIEAQPTIKNALQAMLGSARFKVRLQFAGSNHDGIADFVRFSNPSLIVTYTTP